jgi:hypothetical protein
MGSSEALLECRLRRGSCKLAGLRVSNSWVVWVESWRSSPTGSTECAGLTLSTASHGCCPGVLRPPARIEVYYVGHQQLIALHMRCQRSHQ